MVTEDYVSFEVAKLLKEKGFDNPCKVSYNRFKTLEDTFISEWGKANQYKAPTLQMAMKWLREVHNIFININVIPYTTVTMEQCYYFYKIYRNRRPINFSSQIEDIQFYNTPEEAIEAALKYTLENLI